MSFDAWPADASRVGTTPARPRPAGPRELLRAFGPESAGGRWARLALILAGAAVVVAAGLLLVGPGLRPVAAHLLMGLAPLAVAAACLGARESVQDEGRATWTLIGIGAMLAAIGQAFYARAYFQGSVLAFPSMGFHLLVAFHFAMAEAAILALRPAHQGRLAAEIALDGALLLLGASALVLRFVLDEPLHGGWLTLPHVVAILIGQLAVSSSLLFAALLVFWRDTALPSRVVDGLLVSVLLFTFGDLLTALDAEWMPGRFDAAMGGLRLGGWAALFVTAGLGLAPAGPTRPGPDRELAARRFRQLLIPGAALFLAAWAIDAARRDTVSVPSLVVISLMGICLAARIGTAMYAVEQESIERRHAEGRAARARLRAVTAQMNPHFLFNALHSLSALLRRDASATERALERLGGLLRYGLDSGDELVPLRAEWAFAHDYLEMERIRLGSRLRVEIDVPAHAGDLLVPPFVIQPLVENAVRHGLGPLPRGGTIQVRVGVDGANLVIEVEDDGVGAVPDAVESAVGVGLRAVRAQLEDHFADEARMTITCSPHGGFLVRLEMPAERD